MTRDDARRVLLGQADALARRGYDDAPAVREAIDVLYADRNVTTLPGGATIREGDRTAAVDLADGDGDGVAFMAFAYVIRADELAAVQERVETFLTTCDEAAATAGLVPQPPGTKLGYMAFTMHSLIGASSLRAQGVDTSELRKAVLEMLSPAAAPANGDGG